MRKLAGECLTTSALYPKADVSLAQRDGSFVPITDVIQTRKSAAFNYTSEPLPFEVLSLATGRPSFQDRVPVKKSQQSKSCPGTSAA